MSVNDPTTATSAPWLTTDPSGSVSSASTVSTVGDSSPADTVAVATPTQVTLPDDSDLQPQTGGTFRFALIAEIDGLNPTSSALTVSSGVIMANAVFDTLAAYGADGVAVPYLAESFTPSDDFMSWDVRLRPDVEFHDGTPLDAAAVQYNFESQRTNSLVGLAVKPFYPDSDATEVLDDLTIRFNLLEPNRYWPQTMATQIGMMASPTWLSAALADPTLNQRPVGTGPFVFDTRSEDSITRFVRNDNWWNGSAFLDAIEFVPVPDAATRGDFLIEGEVDGLQTTEPSSILELRADPNLNVLLDDSGAETFIQVNTERGAVRRPPCSTSDRLGNSARGLPDSHRARYVAGCQWAIRAREPVRQPIDRSGRRRPRPRAGVGYQLLHRLPGQLHRRQDQHGVPVARP